MHHIVQSYMQKDEWLVELGFTAYSPEQQDSLWELVVRAVQTKVVDALLDRLNMEDQKRLIQYLSEEDLQSELKPFLSKAIPDYEQLIMTTLQEYRKVLKRDLSRLVRKPEEE